MPFLLFLTGSAWEEVSNVYRDHLARPICFIREKIFGSVPQAGQKNLGSKIFVRDHMDFLHSFLHSPHCDGTRNSELN